MRVSVNKELAASYAFHNTAGVPLSIFLKRVNNLKWSVKEAGSTPYTPRRGTLTHHYKRLYDRIESPLVGFDVFVRRMRSDKDPQEAAMGADASSSSLRLFYHQHPSPAVSYRMFFNRTVSLRWNKERAITQPAVASRQKTSALVRSSKYLASWYNKNKERAAVPWSCFSQRVYKLGWGKDRALTTPSTFESISPIRQFYQNYPNPVVSYGTFHSRVYKHGWSMLEAALTPTRLSPQRSKAERPTFA